MTRLLPIAIACSMCAPVRAEADPAPAPSLLRCERAQSLHRGEVAPCTGLLVPSAEAVRAATCVAVDLPLCERRRDRESEESRLRLTACEQIAQAEADARAETARLLQEALALQRDPVPWYESPAFVAPVTAAGTVAAVLLILWGAGTL